MTGLLNKKWLNIGTGTGGLNAQDIPANFAPSVYTPDQVASEGTDKISAHLKGIDDYLTTNTIPFAKFRTAAYSVQNRFLDLEGFISSDVMPAVSPVSTTISLVVIQSTNASATGTVEIRKNATTGIPAHTTSFSGLSTIASLSILLMQGDLVNVRIASAASTDYPLVTLYI